MKKIQLLSLVLAFYIPVLTPSCTFASFVSNTSATAISRDWKYLKLRDCANLSLQDIAALQDKKMSLRDKISFHIMKISMRKEIKKNPNMLFSEFFNKSRQKRLAWGWWVAIAVGALSILFSILAIVALGSLTNG